ncbi:hypothetical protein Z517_05942 [Fonsecaea pedrosoi CBS 271.37]|uniref:Uncharacterized protein n=1 Tax=Fonsecaea pedrosoi CBS 271.37 TaxID=1442368 RepID=A0A0D2GLE1_9EURO|nr:uncharacterized protein Z517_05942 [Fonsecaea pedrosoi CBS 271.37]KIW79330.1 hypothetical protein Z517_05942 [Fonsecaea pedrosoi CBS 271.37]
MGSCHSPSNADQAEPLANDLSYHILTTYIAAGTTICTWAVCSLLTLAHLARYAAPRRQKQIVRLIWTPGVFAIFSFFGVWHYNLANYLTPIAELYESFALIALFFLLVACVAPEYFEGQLQYFATNPGTPKPSNAASVNWFRKTWITVIQILPTRVVTVTATEIVEATQCHGTTSYQRAMTIISIVQGLLTATCLIGISKFYSRFRSQLHVADRRILYKMGVFKLLVFTQLVQRIIINALSQSDVLKPTEHLSYNDLNLGLNSFLICLETFVLAILFVWPFWPHKAFANSRAGILSAALDAINPCDFFAGIVGTARLCRGIHPDKTLQTGPVDNEQHEYAHQEGSVGNKLTSVDSS